MNLDYTRRPHIEPSKLEQNFWKLHAKYPRAYRWFLKQARRWHKNHPGKHAGMSLFIGRLRWSVADRGTKGLPATISNNQQAFYARLIMEKNPELRGLFRLRRLAHEATFGPPNSSLSSAEHDNSDYDSR